MRVECFKQLGWQGPFGPSRVQPSFEVGKINPVGHGSQSLIAVVLANSQRSLKETTRTGQEEATMNVPAPIWSFEVYETKSWTTRLGNIYGVKLINRVSEYVSRMLRL